MKTNGHGNTPASTPAVERVATMAHQAVNKAADAAAPAADWLTERSEAFSATQKKLLDSTCGYVATNPLKAVGIAVVVGILLSRIIL
jgi:ElaB/YqjD/DUF883 family membrane-anchored ribosome-binding protein